MTLRFETEKHMDFIMGQLTDGFGENEANFMPTKDPNVYTVGIFDTDLWRHHQSSEERRAARIAAAKARR